MLGRLPDSARFDPLRFAAGAAWHPLAGAGRAALAHPAAAARALLDRLAGRRVRARQALIALGGAGHRLRWTGAAPGTATALPPGMALHGTPGAANADIVVLTAAGHALTAGGAEALAGAFADPACLAAYGDALVLDRAGRPALPLLRSGFDRDLLMGTGYAGPVVAVRRAALAKDPLADDLPGAEATDLLLRLAERGAVRHVPAFVSTWQPFDPVPGEPSDAVLRAARVEAAGLALARTGEDGVAAWEDGVVTVRRALPEPRPRVTAIVPTRDRVDLLRTCVESLSRTDWPDLELIVCDNDSRDPAALAYLRELEASGRARVLPCPGPFDFATMNNRAAAAATGRLLAFLNNDVEVEAPDWLALMAAEALRPGIGAVGARLIDGEGRVQHGGVVLGAGGLVTHAHRFFPGEARGYLDRLRATHAVSAVTAACLVIERDKFRSVGGFDAANFAVDFNDVDLCLRLGAAGLRTLVVPRARLLHREAASRRWTPEARARHEAEVAGLRARWGDRLRADPHYHPGFDPDLGTYLGLRA